MPADTNTFVCRDASGGTEASALAGCLRDCQPDRMAEGPDITRIAQLIGDPARGSILSALMSGRALTAGELAGEAGVTPQTASGHLSRMVEAGLLWRRKQGRHQYFALADDEVAHALETLAGLAASQGHLRTRPGPRDAKMREARVCYDHLAGARGVQVFESLARRGLLTVAREDIALTGAGRTEMVAFGIDLEKVGQTRRPLCRVCLDWSERRSHLAGALGAALLDRMIELGWLRRNGVGRDLAVTPPGRTGFTNVFGT